MCKTFMIELNFQKLFYTGPHHNAQPRNPQKTCQTTFSIGGGVEAADHILQMKARATTAHSPNGALMNYPCLFCPSDNLEHRFALPTRSSASVRALSY